MDSSYSFYKVMPKMSSMAQL